MADEKTTGKVVTAQPPVKREPVDVDAPTCDFCGRNVPNPENLRTCPACGASEDQGFFGYDEDR